MPISGCCRKQHPLVLCVGRSWGSCCSRGGEYLPSFAPRMVTLLLRKETRGGGEAATSYCFVPVGHDQRTEPVWRLCARPLETFGPPLINSIRTKRRQVAAALSAAVTTTKQHGTAPTLQAEPSQKKRIPPNASRSSGGSAREGLLSEKPPPSQLSLSIFLCYV